MFDYQEAEANYWYNKFRSLEAKTPYVGTFDLAEQKVVVYNKKDWKAFVADVREQMMEEDEEFFADMSDDSLMECWNDEFFWNYL